VANQSPLSRFERMAGALPSKEIARHPAGIYVAMETEQAFPGVGIWETATGALVWANESVLAATWTPDGSELLLVQVDTSSTSDAAPHAPEDASDGCVFERRLWPQDTLVSACPLQLPFSSWPSDIWVAPTGALAAVRWVDQGASGWEVALLNSTDAVHLVGAGFELASEVGIDTHPALNPNGHYAVSGYQTMYGRLPDHHWAPLQRGRFEVGRIVVIDIAAGIYRDIVIDDAVPAKLHGTASRWADIPVFLDADNFELMLPTGAKRIYSVKE
jgi:hypothetical protein